MTYEVCLDGDFVSWRVMGAIRCQWVPGLYTGIGLMQDGEMVAGVAFEAYNGYNIVAHLSIKDPAATMLLFKLIGRYVFGQLGLKRLTLMADSSNIAAVQLHKRLGAIPEGRLVGAGQAGDDILVSRLTDECRLWRRWNGQKQRSPGLTGLCVPDTTARGVGPSEVSDGPRIVEGQFDHPLRDADLVPAW